MRPSQAEIYVDMLTNFREHKYVIACFIPFAYVSRIFKIYSQKNNIQNVQAE